MAQKRQITKKELKQLISQCAFLPKKDKKRWLYYVDNFGEQERNDVCKYFYNAEKQFKDSMLNILIKNDLQDVYKAKVKGTREKALRNGRKKEEIYHSDKEKKPEDILNKLNEL